MTSIKTFENRERQNLEKDVNKFLEGYENCITSVNLSTFVQDIITDLSGIGYYRRKNTTVNVETANNK